MQAIGVIVNSLNSGAVVCATFLDLRKAFDSLDHVILLQRLHCLGACGTSLWWFASCLSDCVQQVRSDGSFSQWSPVLGGIPQGSALRPLFMLTLCPFRYATECCYNLLMILVLSVVVIVMSMSRVFYVNQ